jgi:hypothetical protein
VSRLPLVAVLVAAASASPATAAEVGFAPVELHVRPIEAFRVGDPAQSFGAVEFRGGLVLSSPDSGFGSWSGLDYAPDGSALYAVADDGHWLVARPVERDGRLVGLEAAGVAPMLDPTGAPVARKALADAEGLRVVVRDGVPTALVSFEQTVAVRAFAGPDFARARPRALALPKWIGRLSANQGLEAIAVAPPAGALAGAIVVIAEHSLDANGNHRAFILDGPRAGAFFLRRTGGYDVTDAAFLADGDLIVLERKVSFPEGFAMRLRRVPEAALMPGATADGAVLLEADARSEIDNMEGLAVHTGASGETLLTLISDDNHNILQRTVVLSFALKPPVPRPQLRPAGATAGAR